MPFKKRSQKNLCVIDDSRDMVLAFYSFYMILQSEHLYILHSKTEKWKMLILFLSNNAIFSQKCNTQRACKGDEYNAIRKSPCGHHNENCFGIFDTQADDLNTSQFTLIFTTAVNVSKFKITIKYESFIAKMLKQKNFLTEYLESKTLDYATNTDFKFNREISDELPRVLLLHIHAYFFLVENSTVNNHAIYTHSLTHIHTYV